MIKSLLILFIISFALMGCEKREKIELKGGFSVFRIYGDARAIIKPDNSILILPGVHDAIDDEVYLVGLRIKTNPEFRLSDGFKDQPYGYFIYNKKTEELVLGLSYSEFLKMRIQNGIDLKLKKERL